MMPVNSMKVLIAVCQGALDKLTYASAGNGSANHLAGEMMKSMASFKMVHVLLQGRCARPAGHHRGQREQ